MEQRLTTRGRARKRTLIPFEWVMGGRVLKQAFVCVENEIIFGYEGMSW